MKEGIFLNQNSFPLHLIDQNQTASKINQLNSNPQSQPKQNPIPQANQPNSNPYSGFNQNQAAPRINQPNSAPQPRQLNQPPNNFNPIPQANQPNFNPHSGFNSNQPPNNFNPIPQANQPNFNPHSGFNQNQAAPKINQPNPTLQNHPINFNQQSQLPQVNQLNSAPQPQQLNQPPYIPNSINQNQAVPVNQLNFNQLPSQLPLNQIPNQNMPSIPVPPLRPQQSSFSQPTQTLTKRDSISNYNLIKILGKGNNGTVHYAQNISTKGIVCIKESDSYGNNVILEFIKKESNVWHNLNHENIVKYHGSFTEGPKHYIVIEFIDGITLEQYLIKNGALSEELAIYLFIQILKAVKHCHSRRVLHRDIKPQNILLTSNLVVKLTDFGTSKVMETDLTSTRIGTPFYMAPELVRNELHSFKVDIWSLGCVLYEMLSATRPFGSDPITCCQKINENPPLSFPQNINISQYARDLILMMLNKDQNTRISADDIITFMFNIEWYRNIMRNNNLSFDYY